MTKGRAISQTTLPADRIDGLTALAGGVSSTKGLCDAAATSAQATRFDGGPCGDHGKSYRKFSDTRATFLPPKTPQAWRWKCHRCGGKYSFAVAQRCLNCGHWFCAVPRKMQGKPKDEELESPTSGGRHCITEFDYHGWSVWGAYRRSRRNDMEKPAGHGDTFALFRLTAARDNWTDGLDRQERRPTWEELPPTMQRKVTRCKERVYLSGRYNCWLHCDFPAECVNRQYTAWVRDGACSQRRRGPGLARLPAIQEKGINDEDGEEREKMEGTENLLELDVYKEGRRSPRLIARGEQERLEKQKRDGGKG
ncbi:uncharacterized protein C8A04DRAFT_15701 [Dichotomopilus funicola]|uniref:Uncharacterized protein n=1 Tax=Dichotomopilus funicola TaxID=1934379 RepID=A0AAN6UV27_9PEZI|nr:hypothetical protein C8A04DRAFT_15701 [Dichotomopilus funicola]